MLRPTTTDKAPATIPAAGWPRLLAGCAVPAGFIVAGQITGLDDVAGWWLLFLASVIAGGIIAASWLYVLVGPLAAIAIVVMILSTRQDEFRQGWLDFTDTCEERVSDPEGCDRLREIDFDDLVAVVGVMVVGVLYVVMAVVSVPGILVGKAAFPHRPSLQARWGGLPLPEEARPTTAAAEADDSPPAPPSADSSWARPTASHADTKDV